MEFAGVE
jgi:hypothetical protein